MSFLEVKSLTKSYKDTNVFNNLNFKIESGEFITLLGPSGCGKSTLLRCIAGLEDISEGYIYIDNKEVSKLSSKDRDISMVFQSYALFPNMTVTENISFGLKMKKISKAKYDKKAKEMINLVELDGKENFYPHQLSGGQQQRVALARALVMEPKILLLDEPLSALDAKIRKNLRLQIRQIQKKLNITTIFVTHDQEEALIISDRVFIIEEGRISQVGSPKEIYASPQNEFVAGFIGSYNIFSSEEIYKLSNKKMEGNIYAVRPEVISIVNNNENEDDCVYIEGEVYDVIILGNILRCYVKTKDNEMIIDTLNRKENHPQNFQKVRLKINLEDFNKVK